MRIFERRDIEPNERYRHADHRLKRRAWIEGSFIGGALVGGLIAQVLYAFSLEGGNRLQTFSLTTIYSLAAVMVGGLFGFLFGVPRYGAPVDDETAASRSPGPTPNTSLEQISDWLIKILVGVTLVQIGDIAETAQELFTELGAALQAGASARVFAACLVVFASGVGFVFGWLGARTWLEWLLTIPTDSDDEHAASPPVPRDGTEEPAGPH